VARPLLSVSPVKTLIAFCVMAVGVAGSWAGSLSGPPADAVDVRPEAVITGATLLILATILRQHSSSRRG
jgi:hypothetical protein